MEKNRASNRYISPFPSIGQFHFKQLVVIRSIKYTPVIEKLYEQYAFAIAQKRCKNFSSRKTSLDFLQCCFSRVSPLHGCLLRLLDVMMLLRLITSDNSPQEIISICLISCQKSLVYEKTVCFLISHQEPTQPTLPTLSGNPNHLEWLIGHSRTIFRRVQQFAILSLSIIARIALVLVCGRRAWVLFCTDSWPPEIFLWQS